MQHVQVLEQERMAKQRTTTAFWEALYELWRLSWYETRLGQTAVPRCIPVGTWLIAINQCRLEHSDQIASLTVEELIHVAGGMVKSKMASQRFQQVPTPQTFVYSITTNAAIEIQGFLCLHVVDQRLRPGLPGSADQLAALSLHEAQPANSKFRYMNLDPRMAELHESRGLVHLTDALKTMSGHKRKRGKALVKNKD